jgi:hypothetical protein
VCFPTNFFLKQVPVLEMNDFIFELSPTSDHGGATAREAGVQRSNHSAHEHKLLPGYPTIAHPHSTHFQSRRWGGVHQLRLRPVKASIDDEPPLLFLSGARFVALLLALILTLLVGDDVGTLSIGNEWSGSEL